MKAYVYDQMIQTVLGLAFFAMLLIIAVVLAYLIFRVASKASRSLRRTVRREARPVGYSRGAFGTAWKDMDRNGRDTRNDILARDLDNVVLDADGDVLSGVLHDPYSGLRHFFSSSQGSAVHVDHVVPLSWAWARGANMWDQNTREHFANDPLNLLAVLAGPNMEKSDKGIDLWMPTNTRFHFTYARLFGYVCKKYSLMLSPAEVDILNEATGYVDERENEMTFAG